MTRRAVFHWRSVILGLLLLLVWVLSGCQALGSSPSQVTLDLTPFLPPEWTPVGALQEINIDQDATVEYLMLYTYDQSGGVGPVGAMILDPQTETIVTEGGGLARGRPTGFPNPYAVLPNYWSGAGQGFIAAPGQQDSIAVHQVAYVPITEGDQPVRPDTLILRGGNNYLTFAWWKNVIDGYGVSQIYAPGGFEGIDWTTWQDQPAPIFSITASAPLNNRSLFCRKTRYDLAEPVEIDPLAYRQAIHYLAGDLGLHFCHGSPAHPFYPEGVVLAYLTDASKRSALLVDALRNDPTAQAQFAQVINPNEIVLVDDVKGYPDIPVSDQLQTTVCAEVVLKRIDDPTQTEKRWLLFTLQHQPPQLDPPTPDRLFIATVNAIPAPAEGVELNCSQIIDNP
jgi:hypothetical protein